MEIFKISARYWFLNVWLIAIACQTTSLLSQWETSYDQWGTSYDKSDDDYPIQFQPDDYSTVPSSSSEEGPQNGQWPVFSKNEWEPTQDFSSNSTPNWPENTVSDDFSFPPTQSIENSETEYPHFTTFDSPTYPQTSFPLSSTEEGKATSYPFDENPSPSLTNFESSKQEQNNLHAREDKKNSEKEELARDKENEQSPNQEFLTYPQDTIPNLYQGKSNVRVTKKHPTSISSSYSESSRTSTEGVIGKQIISDSIVGLESSPTSIPPPTPGFYPHTSKPELIAQTTPTDRPAPAPTPTPASDQIPDLIPETPSSTPLISPSPLTSPLQPSPPTTFPLPPLVPLQSPQPAGTATTPPRAPTIITPTSPAPENSSTITTSTPPSASRALKEISINFNNVAMIEYIRFISRISNKNFIFDDEDLQFNVTIVSEEPTSVENLMAALLQELKIRDLSLMEQGNNIIIHRNPRVRAPARIIANGIEPDSSHESELVTRVFRLNTLDPIKASEIIRPLLSEDALVEVLRDTNNLILTDLVTNVNKIAQLIGTLDAPNSGVTIGQYVVRNAFVDSLVDLATKILQPIAQGNPFVLVPHTVSNSIFIVSNSFIVEKALAILQNLDMNEGRTKILSLETLLPTYFSEEENQANAAQGRGPEVPPEGFPIGGAEEPNIFGPGGIGIEGRPSAIFDESRDFLPGSIGASSRWSRELPVGHIERTLFFIYKLRYRKGDQIEIALRKIANSLQLMGTANIDLISAINSSQWIESSNALIFTGTAIALEKVKELMLEVDVPLRQVFIEMLILDTSITDSLNYGVDWLNRFGGGSTTGEEGFLGISGPVGLPGSSSTGNLVGIEESFTPGNLFPIATNLLALGGFNAGVIGTHLTHNGTRFSSIGGLVRAVHNDTKANILLNPKIITEDNNPAEVFVGGTDRYKTQSITNDLGSLVTNNFQFIDVGTTLRVTPLIGNNGIITLDIIQETTNASPQANATPNQINVDVNLVEVLTKTRTVTKIHVPNGFFVILSGMIQDNETRSYTRIPCLGGIPILGGIGKSQLNNDSKRNLMLFIRPLIIDTEEDLEDITKRQQDVYREKCKFRRSWNYEIDEALNFLNVKPTDSDEIGCNQP